MNVLEPLPCPFCGHLPKFRHIPKEIARPEIPNGYWSLGCDNRKHDCNVAPSAFGDTKAEAVTNWNRRAPAEDIVFAHGMNELSQPTLFVSKGGSNLFKLPVGLVWAEVIATEFGKELINQ